MGHDSYVRVGGTQAWTEEVPPRWLTARNGCWNDGTRPSFGFACLSAQTNTWTDLVQMFVFPSVQKVDRRVGLTNT